MVSRDSWASRIAWLVACIALALGCPTARAEEDPALEALRLQARIRLQKGDYNAALAAANEILHQFLPVHPGAGSDPTAVSMDLDGIVIPPILDNEGITTDSVLSTLNKFYVCHFSFPLILLMQLVL